LRKLPTTAPSTNSVAPTAQRGHISRTSTP